MQYWMKMKTRDTRFVRVSLIFLFFVVREQIEHFKTTFKNGFQKSVVSIWQLDCFTIMRVGKIVFSQFLHYIVF